MVESKDGVVLSAETLGNEVILGTEESLVSFRPASEGMIENIRLAAQGMHLVARGPLDNQVLSATFGGQAFLQSNTKAEAIELTTHGERILQAIVVGSDRWAGRTDQGNLLIWDDAGEILHTYAGGRPYLRKLVSDALTEGILVLPLQGPALRLDANGQVKERLGLANDVYLDGHLDLQGQVILLGSSGLQLCTTSGDCSTLLGTPKQPMHTLVADDESDRFFVFGDDEKAFSYQLSTAERDTFVHDSRVVSAQLHPTQDYLLTASEDGVVQVWDLEGNVVMSIPTHTYPAVPPQFTDAGDHFTLVMEEHKLIRYPLPRTAFRFLSEGYFEQEDRQQIQSKYQVEKGK